MMNGLFKKKNMNLLFLLINLKKKKKFLALTLSSG